MLLVYRLWESSRKWSSRNTFVVGDVGLLSEVVVPGAEEAEFQVLKSFLANRRKPDALLLLPACSDSVRFPWAGAAAAVGGDVLCVTLATGRQLGNNPSSQRPVRMTVRQAVQSRP